MIELGRKSMDDGIPLSEVYLDNTTMIGVAQLVADPAVHASAYTLLDLETFCEAFILYDRVTSLRQQSVHYFEKSLSTRNLQQMAGLFEQMRAAGVFSSVYAGRGDGHPNNKIEDIVDQLVEKAQFFDREPHLPIDHYLIKEGAFLGKGEIEKARTTFPLSSFDMRPTCVYLATSLYTGKPYLASSIRVPTVRCLVDNANRKGSGVIQKCLDLCESPMRNRIAEAEGAFDGIDLRLSLPPLMKMVLEQCNAASEIPSALASIRQRPDVRRLRRWFGVLHSHLQAGDADKVCTALQQINDICDHHRRQPDSVVDDVVTVLTIRLSPLSNILKLIKTNTGHVLSWIKNRHVLFLKNLASSTNCVKDNRELIKRVFNITLSDEDENIFAKLCSLDASSKGGGQ
jgi:hypothetical protein